MAIEKKVYSPWAFTKDEMEKRDMNNTIYNELCEKYKISSSSVDNIDDYDIVLRRTPGYNHSTYEVIKNTTDLSQDELALICDNGNLCFGYRCDNNIFIIYID